MEFRVVLAPAGPVIVDLTKALEKPGSELNYVNGFRLAGGEAVLLFAAMAPLAESMLADIARFRHEHRASIGPDFDLEPESGPRVAIITADDDGYRNVWDLSLSSPRA